ncbi:MAG TPA: 3-hydroxyacyl-ACP dehydratase FabZ [Thermoanaerobaculia bacterium]|nr:3-hydroxyacyl-ACP dehydratase FabZ [Thermoanaerobaculia bacterium]
MSSLNIIEIMKLLPHRYPMLLVDRVLEISEDSKRIVGLKNVSANEQFFQGHFPGSPVMPGVLIVEAMAQCSALLGLKEMSEEERAKKLFLFGGIDKARFRRPVVPGDQLILECEVLHRRASTVKMRGVAKVNGAVVAEAELLSMLVDRPE